MAKGKPQEDPPAGSPAWMATFSDLMNLLLCFFVLLFSMSTVNEEKYEALVASLNSSFSVLPSGGSTIVEEGQFISSGISQLKEFDRVYEEKNEENNEEDPVETTTQAEEYKKSFEEQAKMESEKIKKKVEELAKTSGISDDLDVKATTQYAMITMSGALLFDSGSADIKAEAMPMVGKLGRILENYKDNGIEIEGHTDDRPISTPQFANNRVLSTFRALAVADYLMANNNLNPKMLKYSGKGEYDPIATNKTAEGRAKNRRVVIKVYNSLSTSASF